MQFIFSEGKGWWWWVGGGDLLCLVCKKGCNPWTLLVVRLGEDGGGAWSRGMNKVRAGLFLVL